MTASFADMQPKTSIMLVALGSFPNITLIIGNYQGMLLKAHIFLAKSFRSFFFFFTRVTLLKVSVGPTKVDSFPLSFFLFIF